MPKMLDPRDVIILKKSDEVAKRVQELASMIARDYQHQSILLVSVLKGSFIFAADLIRALWGIGFYNAEIDFIGIKSYGVDTESSRNPKITKDLDTDVTNRHVLIVEDIVDTGWSMDALQRLLKERQVASLKTIVLLSKESRREVEVRIDYVGFTIEGWVEGYGLDAMQGEYRGRPEIVMRNN